MLDRVERQVELGDHPARLEQRQDGPDPIVRSVVEGDDHRSLRERRPLVPVRGEVARQDRRVAVEEEPVELGGEGGRQDVIGGEPALPRGRPARVGRRDLLDAVVVEDRHRRRRVGGRDDRARRGHWPAGGRDRRRRRARRSGDRHDAAPGSARPGRRWRRSGGGRRRCTRTCPRRSRATRPRSRAAPRTGGRGWLVRSAGVAPSSSFDPDLESRSARLDRVPCRGSEPVTEHGAGGSVVRAGMAGTAAERWRVVPAARLASSHVRGRLQAVTFVNSGCSVCREGPPPVSFSPVATTERDFYVILGVERSATDAEIKRAFRKLAQQWHPDVNTDPAAQERFKEINEAYQVLSDPERRPRYDMFGRAGVDGGAGGPAAPAASRVRRLLRHLRRVLRWRRRRRLGAARSTAARRRPALRPADHLRGGGQGDREGDRVLRPPALRDVPRQRRQGGQRADHLPAVQRPRRGPLGAPDDARPDGQRERLSALPWRGQDHRDAVRDLPRRRPHRTQADAAGDDPGRHRRGSPDPALERGRGRAARWAAGQPVRRGPRPAPSEPDARGDGAVLRGQGLDRPGRARDADHGPDRRGRGRGRDQGRARSRTPRSGCAARACRTSGGRASAATSTSWSTSSCRPSCRRRQRELLAAYARGIRRGGRPRRRRCSRSSGWVEPRRRRRRRRLAGALGRGRRRGGRGGQRDPRPGGARRDLGRARVRAVDEGLGARLDPTRPAIVRAYLPARDRAAADRAAAEVAEALGHLQAFGLRPIGELRTRVVDEADWAEAWKAYFPVMRVGRRLVIRPTWRRHRRAPDDVVLALDPGMAFGTGLHPTTRLCLAGIEALADRGVLAGARVLDVGCGSGILAIAALQARGGHGARRRHRPDRHRGDDRQRPAQPARPAAPRAPGQPAERRAGRSTSCSPTSSPGCSCRSRRPCATSFARAARCWRRASSSTARPRSATAFEAAGLRGHRAGLSEGDWVALEAVRRGVNRVPALRSARCRPTSRSCSSRTSSSRSAWSCRRSCCRSRCGRGGRRSSREAASSRACSGRRRTARSRSGSGWR